MAKTIKDYMSANVLCVDGLTPLLAVVGKMRLNNTGAVLVKEKNPNTGIVTIAGIFTERDFLSMINIGDYAKLGTVQIRDVMTRGIKSVDSMNTYSQVVELMQKHNIRHMPVVENNMIIGIVSLRNLLHHYYDNFENLLKETVASLASAVEKRDPYTAGHQQRVAQLAVAIAEAMDLDKKRIPGLSMASIIHDVGKLYVPAELLTKPGKLTDAEMNLMKEHAQKGYEILKGINFPWPVADIVVQHHERLDGTGYPERLHKDEILLEAKILAVADTVEAMASHRPYRAALGIEAALGAITQGKNVSYDPVVVDCCCSLFNKNKFKFTFD